jgi:hypothetical protein
MMMIVSFLWLKYFYFPCLASGFDPVKMATDALNSITEKLPFKLPWK